MDNFLKLKKLLGKTDNEINMLDGKSEQPKPKGSEVLTEMLKPNDSVEQNNDSAKIEAEEPSMFDSAKDLISKLAAKKREIAEGANPLQQEFLKKQQDLMLQNVGGDVKRGLSAQYKYDDSLSPEENKKMELAQRLEQSNDIAEGMAGMVGSVSPINKAPPMRHLGSAGPRGKMMKDYGDKIVPRSAIEAQIEREQVLAAREAERRAEKLGEVAPVKKRFSTQAEIDAAEARISQITDKVTKDRETKDLVRLINDSNKRGGKLK